MSKKPYKHPLPIITPQKPARWESWARMGAVAYLVGFWYVFIVLVKKAME